jgi:hypothetical protein
MRNVSLSQYLPLSSAAHGEGPVPGFLLSWLVRMWTQPYAISAAMNA